MVFQYKQYCFLLFCIFSFTFPKSVIITSKNGLIVSCKNKQKYTKKITISFANGLLRINGLKMPRGRIIISPRKGSLHLGDKKIKEPLLMIHTRDAVTISRLKKKKNTKKIRVLLAQKQQESKKPWYIQSPSGFEIKTQGRSTIMRDKKVAVRFYKNSLWLNNKRIKNSFCLQPCKGSIVFNDYCYEGFFTILHNKENNEAMLINVIDLESYVSSVLKTESWPGWPLEVNKVFAITSRTYAISMMLEAKKHNKLFDVKNTNSHQTYSGCHAIKMYKQATSTTKGVFLTHEDKPILAMFDSCCGGIIPAHIDGIDFEKAPYLARQYPCVFCKKYRIFEWQVEYPIAEFAAKLDTFKLKKIKNLKILKTDRAGLVQQIEIQALPNNINISSKQLYSALGQMKSYCFSIRKRFGKVLLKGRGFGHHLGLCQWGARQMVADGWNYKSILNFYYPGCQFMKLSA